jgi:hypothetical protein
MATNSCPIEQNAGCTLTLQPVLIVHNTITHVKNPSWVDAFGQKFFKPCGDVLQRSGDKYGNTLGMLSFLFGIVLAFKGIYCSTI